MIWFFLMGMVAGAVGVILVLRWWFITHMQRVTKEEFNEFLRRTEETDMPCGNEEQVLFKQDITSYGNRSVEQQPVRSVENAESEGSRNGSEEIRWNSHAVQSGDRKGS